MAITLSSGTLPWMVVHLVKNVAAAGLENLQPLLHVSPHVFGRGGAQHLLGIAPAAQNTRRWPNSFFRRAGSMLAAEVWTGLRMSTPASMKWGIR